MVSQESAHFLHNREKNVFFVILFYLNCFKAGYHSLRKLFLISRIQFLQNTVKGIWRSITSSKAATFLCKDRVEVIVINVTYVTIRNNTVEKRNDIIAKPPIIQFSILILNDYKPWTFVKSFVDSDFIIIIIIIGYTRWFHSKKK